MGYPSWWDLQYITKTLNIKNYNYHEEKFLDVTHQKISTKRKKSTEEKKAFVNQIAEFINMIQPVLNWVIHIPP